MKKVINGTLLILTISLFFTCTSKTDQMNETKETTHEVIIEKDHTEVKNGMADTLRVGNDTTVETFEN